jgi:hypothetical protein
MDSDVTPTLVAPPTAAAGSIDSMYVPLRNRIAEVVRNDIK